MIDWDRIGGTGKLDVSMRITISTVISLVFALAAPLARASEEIIVDAAPVAELFTSQSCSSCPPAEAHFRRLAARRDVVSLQWHVDYWNDLRVGAAGKWRDPYSSAANTARQRAYNRRLRGTAGVYTPQAVVAGREETVGSRGDAVNALIDAAAAAQGAPLQIAFAADGAHYAVSIDQADAGAETIEVVEIISGATTRVRGGENNGRTLEAAHIAAASLEFNLSDGPVRIAAPAEGASCAVLVRDAGGAILGGAYCP